MTSICSVSLLHKQKIFSDIGQEINAYLPLQLQMYILYIRRHYGETKHPWPPVLIIFEKYSVLIDADNYTVGGEISTVKC